MFTTALSLVLGLHFLVAGVNCDVFPGRTESICDRLICKHLKPNKNECRNRLKCPVVKGGIIWRTYCLTPCYVNYDECVGFCERERHRFSQNCRRRCEKRHHKPLCPLRCFSEVFEKEFKRWRYLRWIQYKKTKHPG